MIASMCQEEKAATESALLADFAAQGSHAAFTELVNRHASLVFAVCLRVLGERSAAEDASQAAFLVFFRKGRALAPDTVLAGWLYRVAELCARDALRRRKRRVRREREAAVQERHEPRAAGRWEELRPHLDAALAALPTRQRDALVLHYFQGLSRAEVARTLACHEETVHTHLARGLHKLRERLRRAGLAVPAVALTECLRESAIATAPQELAAGITKACLAKAASATAGAVAKHVAAKLFWTPLKTLLLTAVVTAALVLPAALLALVHKESLESAAPLDDPITLPAPPAQLAPPPVQDHAGLHLDDTKLWKTAGNLPSKISAARIEVALKGQGYPRTFALLNQQSWKVDREPASFRLAFAFTPTTPREGSFRIEACVNLNLKSTEPQTITKLQLLYQDETLFTNLVEPHTGRIDEKNRRPLSMGRHLLELAVAKEEWMTWLDGKPLYRGPHGLAAESVVFLAGALEKDEPDDLKLSIEDVQVGKTELPSTVEPVVEF